MISITFKIIQKGKGFMRAFLNLMAGFLFVENGNLNVRNTGLTIGGILAIAYLILGYFCFVIINLLILEGISFLFGPIELISDTWILTGGFLMVIVIGAVFGMVSAYLYNILRSNRSKNRK